ncbi:argininosuccinate lyase [Haloechinothrix alba]|uniref:Argininosuccinate lyase n=1 Tax=Haloechinothrix alba TaxID=664784 RepID=A0A238X137_9PSEU|nr:argininosuccinate lyase [Haloechinothrix alba]
MRGETEWVSDLATLLMIESWMRSTGHSLPGVIKRLGHRYVLLTRDPDLYPACPDGQTHPVVAEADEIVRVDTNDTARLVDASRAVATRDRIDGVLTTCDYYLEAVAEVADALGLAGPSGEVMRVATRKHLVRKALQDAGLANPAFAVTRTWEDCLAAAAEIGYPLVAKPTDLNAGTAVRRIDDDASLKDAFWEITGTERNTRDQPLERAVLLEQLIDGQELSVEAATCHGETTIIGITDKTVTGAPAFVESGHMFPALLDREEARDVEAYVRAALDAIGYTHGLTHTEVRLTPNGPRIVEINPRQAGGYIFDLVHRVTGTHPLELLVELSLGRNPQVGTASAPTLTAEAPSGSAAVFFVMSPVEGTLQEVHGTAHLDADPAVVRWSVPTPAAIRRPRSNDAYLGHVLVVDPAGRAARERAETAVGGLALRLTDGRTVAPVGVPSGLVAGTPRPTMEAG